MAPEDLQEMLAIVSHDAGGAEILSSWALRGAEPYCLVLDGPATAVFMRKLGAAESLPLELAIQRCNWVLCGTSWQSGLERQAVRLARESGKRVVAFLDHWVNYRERFLENGYLILPHEIWVGDPQAEQIARELFPGTPVCLHDNPYFADIRLELDKAKPRAGKSDRIRILYVCEPIREHALRQHGDERHWGYTEEDALIFFLRNTAALGRPVAGITVRPHPAESKRKYDWARQYSDLNVRIGGDRSLLEEIAAADVVAGCESMAMVVGLIAGKRVVSCIPPGGRACTLPQPDIEHLQSLVVSQSKPGYD